jgi:SAM-dependent MidA family methyltransferase
VEDPRARESASPWLPWQQAWAEALYGPAGFYRRESPVDHFRTSAHASSLLGRVLARVAVEVDAHLGRPARLDVVDVGAGRAELLLALAAALPTELRDRVALTAVEVGSRPESLDPAVAWADRVPDQVSGLLLAHEWLDNVPCPLAEVDPAGDVRLVEVDPLSGRERLGPQLGAADRRWLDRWWPATEPGERAEVGRPRDEAWAGVVSALRQGVALAVDYAHARGERAAGSYAAGTLAAYRHGRAVPPVPDGRSDLTAHVALDACAAAGEEAGATRTALRTQREALRRLGITGARPDAAMADADPRAYLLALQEAAHAGELLDPAGLGGFGWLLQAVGCPLPSAFD